MSLPSTSVLHVPNPQQQTPTKVVAGYTLHHRLGSGSFATVYKGIKAVPGAPGADNVAVKAITRKSEKLTKKVLQNLEIEISILRTYRHRNIVCLQNVQKTERHFYLILEYCGGGDVQKLIRGRKAGRLTERLTRRLMRDLGAGLKFLWSQELIHRDIKPQNLLLTGPLPLDECNDPEKTQALEDKRQEVNFPSSEFSLKIADFGFARHLQTTSLAETLCGSPLYMAPEILQHQRYDAKADLWSVGTVLFEMISGRPPFHGENHIDLLRNIQRKAVRLPADVRVSMECVNLLRLLLNRNPVSRAGFKEFFDACDAFVSLGCEGTTTEDTGACRKMIDLGTINENDEAPGAQSMMTVQTVANQPQSVTTSALTLQMQQAIQHPIQQPTNIQQPISEPSTQPLKPKPLTASPPFGNFVAPTALIANPPGKIMQTRSAKTRVYGGLTPLEASPPSCGQGIFPPSHLLPPMPSLGPAATVQATNQYHTWQQQTQQHIQTNEVSLAGRRKDGSPLQNSTDDSGFVMVEHGSLQQTTTIVSSSGASKDVTARLEQSPPQSPRYYFNSNPVVSNRAEYMVVNDRRPSKGILSTSPGTGRALIGLLGGRPRIGYDTKSGTGGSPSRYEAQIGAAAKMLAAAEDVGRRAVSVAHLGDTRAYLALRYAFMNESNCSFSSATPMDGVEEESGCNFSVADVTGSGRRVSISTDRTMTDAKIVEEEEEADEMPFAISPDTPSMPFASSPETPPTLMTGMPSRSSVLRFGKGSGVHNVVKPTPSMIKCHFSEALSCYVKGLKMLKGSVSAVNGVEKDLDSLSLQRGLRSDQLLSIKKMQKRCGVIVKWLSGQFRGVLERADASNAEISKVSQQQSGSQQQPQDQHANHQHQDQHSDEIVTCVEELIYNHALTSGREGAVKQLLGQYEAARSCYRSAGLLAETLLMESSLGADDRKILEGYVDGFAARITELDGILMQQSRQGGSGSAGTSAPRRSGSGVVGLIGHATQSPTFSLVPSGR